jgi:hypothetical protein
MKDDIEEVFLKRYFLNVNPSLDRSDKIDNEKNKCEIF